MLTEEAVMEFPYHRPKRPAQLVRKAGNYAILLRLRDFLILDDIRLVAANAEQIPELFRSNVKGIREIDNDLAFPLFELPHNGLMSKKGNNEEDLLVQGLPSPLAQFKPSTPVSLFLQSSRFS
jgi:hypothetical protein